jgi:hypothetical protein
MPRSYYDYYSADRCRSNSKPLITKGKKALYYDYYDYYGGGSHLRDRARARAHVGYTRSNRSNRSRTSIYAVRTVYYSIYILLHVTHVYVVNVVNLYAYFPGGLRNTAERSAAGHLAIPGLAGRLGRSDGATEPPGSLPKCFRCAGEAVQCLHVRPDTGKCQRERGIRRSFRYGARHGAFRDTGKAKSFQRVRRAAPGKAPDVGRSEGWEDFPWEDIPSVRRRNEPPPRRPTWHWAWSCAYWASVGQKIWAESTRSRDRGTGRGTIRRREAAGRGGGKSRAGAGCCYSGHVAPPARPEARSAVAARVPRGRKRRKAGKIGPGHREGDDSSPEREKTCCNRGQGRPERPKEAQ